MEHDHVNYARTGPGAARGIVMLRGTIIGTDLRGDVTGQATARFITAGFRHTLPFFYDASKEKFEVGQAVEITVASFDA